MSHTESDLRATLDSLALDGGAEPDVTDLRARLRTATADRVETAGASDADVIDLDAVARAPRRARSRRGVILVAAAAIVAAIVGLAVAVLPAGKPGPIDPADALRDFGGQQFPGTVAVAYFRGQGPRTLTIPARRLPAGFTWRAQVRCEDTGRMFLNGGGEPECPKGDTFTVDVPSAQPTVRVETSARTSWQLVLMQGPLTRTNGSMAYPADSAFTRATPPAGLTRGRGNGVAAVPAATGTFVVKVLCRGTGVRLPKVVSDRPGSTTRKTGAVTATCFRGFMYQWQNVRLAAGQQLRLLATAGTTWQVFISLQ